MSVNSRSQSVLLLGDVQLCGRKILMEFASGSRFVFLGSPTHEGAGQPPLDQVTFTPALQEGGSESLRSSSSACPGSPRF